MSPANDFLMRRIERLESEWQKFLRAYDIYALASQTSGVNFLAEAGMRDEVVELLKNWGEHP